MLYVIKRNGNSQHFSENKLQSSIYKSCRAANLQKYDSNLICTAALLAFNQWANQKTEITSKDIRHQTAQILLNINHDAGYLYKHNRIID